MDVGDLLRTARRRAGLTQAQLAERAGTSAPAISFYENGERMPRVDTLQRILEATGARVTIAAEVDADTGADVSHQQRATLDLEENARRLADVLDLAEALPQEHERELAYPVLRDLLG